MAFVLLFCNDSVIIVVMNPEHLALQTLEPQIDLDAQLDVAANPQAFESEFGFEPSDEALADLDSMKILSGEPDVLETQTTGLEIQHLEEPHFNADLLDIFWRSAGNPELSKTIGAFLVTKLAIDTAIYQHAIVQQQHLDALEMISRDIEERGRRSTKEAAAVR